MTLNIYNTLNRKKEQFNPIEKGKIGLYSCGPTIYSYAHIGNFRAYICVDILKRYLKYKGFTVTHVMNLTDVDDKTIRDSQKEGKKLSDFTEQYAKAFFEDLDALNIDRADEYPRATDYIKEMVAIIEQLKEKGIAYDSKDGVYFDISKFSEYGKLSHLKLEGLETGKRVKVDEYDKDNVQDFALWKFWDESDGDVFWETSLGKGRPGWHIECSAMSMKHLGNHFDIHAGGIDLVFPHHENEIAQSEASCGEPFANYWFHNEHLHVNGKKMSKSLGNFFTLRDLLDKGHKAAAIRYFLLSQHYRVQLNLTEEGIVAAAHAVDRINEFVSRLATVKDGAEGNVAEKISSVKEKFEQAMDDDLNMSEALSHVFDFIRDVNQLIDEKKTSSSEAGQVLEVMRSFDTVLGVISEQKEEELSSELMELIEKREEARRKKDFATADKIRDELKAHGIVLTDTDQGVQWKVR